VKHCGICENCCCNTRPNSTYRKNMREKWQNTVRTFIFSYKQMHSSLVRTGKTSYASKKSQVLQDIQTGYKKLYNAGDVKPEQYRYVDTCKNISTGITVCALVPLLLGCSQSPSIAPATPKNPPPYISLLFLCSCSDGSNQRKIWAAGGKSVFI